MTSGIKDRGNMYLNLDVDIKDGIESTNLSEELKKYISKEMDIQKFFEKTLEFIINH